MSVKKIIHSCAVVSLALSANAVCADVVPDPDFNDNILSMPSVSSGDKVYTDVQLELNFENGSFTLVELGSSKEHFESVTVGVDEKLVDNIAKLSWVNGTHACHINANAAMTATTDVVEFCDALEFAGQGNWRAPTSAEISNMIIQADRLGVQLNYINPSCQFMAASDGFVQTENTSEPGKLVESAVNSGSRCVTEN